MRRLTLALAALGAALLLTGFGYVAWIVADASGGSVFKNVSRGMEPTLLVGERFTVRQLSPADRGTLARGELVVHAWPLDRTKRFVKRVMGLPGDTVAMVAGVLHVNGLALSESYAWHEEPTIDPVVDEFRWQRAYLVGPQRSDTVHYVASRNDWGPIEVPASQCFVLGDNRDNSLDSRYWGFLSLDEVLGHARRVYFSSDPITGRVRWARLAHRLR